MNGKYVINPGTGRPIQLYSKQYYRLIKKNILKDDFVTADVITFDPNESEEIIKKVKNAIPKKAGSFVTAYKNKSIQKNYKIGIDSVLEYVIDNYPKILEDSLDAIDDNDDDQTIKNKFEQILHKKLLSG